MFDEYCESIRRSDRIHRRRNQPWQRDCLRPSEKAKKRVATLLRKEKTSSLSVEEKSELDHYLQLEHLMRLAKARARRYLSNE